MHHNSIRLLITAPLLLCILSLFSIADTTPQASGITAEWTAPPEEAPTNGDIAPDHASEPRENDQLQSDKRRIVDYKATADLLLERYPYALMSYLSEMDAILTSEEPEKQIFAIFRLSYLGSRNFQLVADPEAIPEQWQPYFIAISEHTRKSGQTCHQIIGQVTIPDSNIRIRVFKLTEDEDPLSDAQTKSKIVLALSGEKSNEAVQCLVTQSKPAHPVSSPCSLAVKTPAGHCRSR